MFYETKGLMFGKKNDVMGSELRETLRSRNRLSNPKKDREKIEKAMSSNYDERGDIKEYSPFYLNKIIYLISDIYHAKGFIEAVSLEENPKEPNSQRSKELAEKTIKNIEKYRKIASKEFENRFLFSGLEKICKKVLE